MCFLYATAVLGITTLWVYTQRDMSFASLALAMYFPTVMAVAAAILEGELSSFIYTATGLHSPVSNVLHSAVAALTVCLIVGACVALILGLGWGKRAEVTSSAIHAHNSNHLWGFLRAAGEEIGWRSYLLPCLMTSYPPEVAIIIGGIIWGLFHVPVMVLLSYRLKPYRAYTTVAVQCCACVLAAFPHSWVAVKAGYGLWPSTVMHWLWNIINPLILGSIYTQTDGHIAGSQWLINGEGLTGCFIMLPVAIFTVWELQNPIL